jgi:hypothetical protein
VLRIVGVRVSAFLQQAVAGVRFAVLSGPYQGRAILMEDMVMVENGISDRVQDFRGFSERIHVLCRREEQGGNTGE